MSTCRRCAARSCLRSELWDAESPGLRVVAHHSRHLRDRFVGDGMTDRQLADVRALLADHRFRACSYPLYSVQGRRPPHLHRIEEDHLGGGL